jgi:hypothetical protein
MTTKEITGFPAAQIQQGGQRTFEIADVQKVEAANPAAGVKQFTIKGKPAVRLFDVVIVGGGMGGIAAAIRAAEAGFKVAVTEETDWLGGQMTAQGVSALDENRLIETSGGTRLYQQLRAAIRAHYRQYALDNSPTAELDLLNPGNCWVSRLSFEPQVAQSKITELLASYARKGLITVFLRSKVLEAKVKDRRIKAVIICHLDREDKFSELRCRFVIDATELGDLLPMLHIPYASGAESRSETGEPHAPADANPENVQDFTYPFVLELMPQAEKGNKIPKPPFYEDFERAGKLSFSGYRMFDCAERKDRSGSTQKLLPFWTYRRLIARENFNKQFPSDIAMINWEAHDLRGENIIDQTSLTLAKRLSRGKALSLSFLHWLQTEAPRDEGGNGYAELKLRPELLGTSDGLSKYPYIRESRRIKALRIVKEDDIAAATNHGARAKLFPDSIGIGHYPIDIHGHQDVDGTEQDSKPFQIPLAAMLQSSISNFLPACKNIGTTHVTNGAYRLHPIEWAIGEAAGVVAAYSLQHRTNPQHILRNKRKLRAIQRTLIEAGSPVFWFEDVPTNHPSFAAIQFLAVSGIWPLDDNTLFFQPDKKVSLALAVTVITRIARKTLETKIPVAREPLTSSALKAIAEQANFGTAVPEFPRERTVTAAEFAEIAYKWATAPANFGRS